jgi:hypothetical protein
MPKCKNSNKYFTGKEPSPRGLGYHACAEQLNTERIGRDTDVWHVKVFGPTHIQRWARGLSSTSQYIHVGQILKLPTTTFMEQGIGLQYPHTNPYNVSAWCPYSFKPKDTNHVEITPNDLGILLRPVLVQDFIQVYMNTLNNL